MAAQQIASPHPYRKEYKEQLVGKGPHDPTIGYPEHDHHKKVGSYTKAVGFLFVFCFEYACIIIIVMVLIKTTFVVILD